MSRNVELLDNNDVAVSPATNASVVLMENGKTVQEHIGELESDMFSPIITQTSSMAKLGQGDNIDVSNNVEGGFYKSGVLYGNSLVNINQNSGWREKVANGNYVTDFQANVERYKPNTEYLVKIEFDDDTGEKFGVNVSHSTCIFKASAVLEDTSEKVYYVKLETKEVLSEEQVALRTVIYGESGLVRKYRISIFEYQEGMENWDIPYFEGMSSVKMPILTNIGKQLFNKDGIELDKALKWQDGAVFNEENSFVSHFIKVDEGRYFISGVNSQKTQVFGYDENFIARYVFGNNGKESIIDGVPAYPYEAVDVVNSKYVRVAVRRDEGAPQDLNVVQFEKGEKITHHEDYKSNTLSPLEEVELHGYGDLQDTLNLATGELTRYFYLFDSTQYDMTISALSLANTGELHFAEVRRTDIPIAKNYDGLSSSHTACDTVLVGNPYSSSECLLVGVHGTSFGADIRISIPMIEQTVEAYNQWVTENPFKILYPVASPTVSTMQIHGSPIGYKDGHIQLSSEGLIPTLEYSVPTSRTGQITQNSTLLVRHSQELGHLSELFADTYVSTALRRSTLQLNAGVVTQSSDTTSLYENFMALIDYKTNKDSIDTDDLLHRANTIYLTGGLVDWQYESIMEALSRHKEVSEWQETLSY